MKAARDSLFDIDRARAKVFSPVEENWQRRAACDQAWDYFFAVECEHSPKVPCSACHRENRRLEEAAKSICRRCPVAKECLDYALKMREPWGVWGGMTPNERKALYPDAFPMTVDTVFSCGHKRTPGNSVVGQVRAQCRRCKEDRDQVMFRVARCIGCGRSFEAPATKGPVPEWCAACMTPRRRGQVAEAVRRFRERGGAA